MEPSSFLLGFLGKAVGQLVEVASQLQQFLVVALFDDPALVEHKNFVASFNGGEAVGHDDCCHAFDTV